jgi:hypothetical protein
MPQKKHKAEEIVAKLRQVDVLLSQGRTVGEAVRSIGVAQFTYYRWRKEFGGLRGDQVKRLKDLEKENDRQGSVGPDAGEADSERGCLGTLLSPSRRRRCIDHVMVKFSVSERFACRVLGQCRSTQRKTPQSRPDEEALTADIISLASRYDRYGYRRITAMLRSEGWTVNAKRVERIWRREGLKVPQKQPKRGRLWLNDGSCIRLRPEHPNHVWSYDFVEGRTHNGRKFRMLNIIDEFTRECLAIRIDRKLNSTDVIDALSDLFSRHPRRREHQLTNDGGALARTLRVNGGIVVGEFMQKRCGILVHLGGTARDRRRIVNHQHCAGAHFDRVAIAISEAAEAATPSIAIVTLPG